MNYPPPYQDLRTLAANLCCGESTIEAWVRQGKFPRPRRLNGKNVWKWTEVERHIAGEETRVADSEVDQVEAIRHATQKASRHYRA